MFDDVFSPGWWFSAVFLAVVLNVISSYLKSYLDRFFSWISSSHRRRSEAAEKEFMAEVEKLIQNEFKLAAAAEEETRLRLRAIMFFMLTSFSLITLGLVVVMELYLAQATDISSTTLFSEPHRWIVRVILGSVLVFFMMSAALFTSANTLGTKVKSAREALARIEDAKDLA